MTELWETPQDIFEALDSEFRFTVDVCALPENRKCRRFYSPEDDGLAQHWDGETCWMNPPYGRGIERWMKKAYEHQQAGGTLVALIPNRSNAPWWHEYVMKAAEIRFIRSKVKFLGPVAGVPFWGSVIAVFKPHSHETKVISFVRNKKPQHLIPSMQSTCISGERIEYSPGSVMGFEWLDIK